MNGLTIFFIFLFALAIGIVAGIFLQKEVLFKKGDNNKENTCSEQPYPEVNCPVLTCPENNCDDIQFSEDKLYNTTMQKLYEIDVIRDNDIYKDVSFQEQVDRTAKLFMSSYEAGLDCMVKSTNKATKLNPTKDTAQMKQIEMEFNACMNEIFKNFVNTAKDIFESYYTPMNKLATNVTELAEKGAFDNLPAAKDPNFPFSKKNSGMLRQELNTYNKGTHNKNFNILESF